MPKYGNFEISCISETSANRPKNKLREGIYGTWGNGQVTCPKKAKYGNFESQNVDQTNFSPFIYVEWPKLHLCFHWKSTRTYMFSI